MSVIIQNISQDKGIDYGTGMQHYVLRINNKIIAYFEHNFSDGLSVCLQKAALAAADPNRHEKQVENELLMAILKGLSK